MLDRIGELEKEQKVVTQETAKTLESYQKAADSYQRAKESLKKKTEKTHVNVSRVTGFESYGVHGTFSVCVFLVI